jgi:hypothetical protein
LELVSLLPDDEEETSFLLELNVNPNLAETILSTWSRRMPDGQDTVILPRDLANLLKILLSRRYTVTVGIWDLGAFAAWLPSWLSVMNRAQATFTFFQVRAAVPVGLVSRPTRIAALARASLADDLPEEKLAEIQENVIAEDFFARAKDVQRDVGVDYLIGITPYLLAGSESGQIYWNRYAASSDKLILLSTQGLRTQAEAEGRDFEMAVSLLLLKHLLVAVNPNVELHVYGAAPKTEAEIEHEAWLQERGQSAEDTGEYDLCVFGYDENDPSNISRSLRQPLIERRCLRRMEPANQHSAAALVEVLHRHIEEDDSAPPPPSGSGPNIGNSSSSTYPSGSTNH